MGSKHRLGTIAKRPPVTHHGEERRTVLLWMAVLCAAVLGADVLLPRSVAVAGLYILPILLSLWVGRRRVTLLAAMACTLLTVGGLLLTTADAPLWQGLANRAIVLFAVWSTAGLAWLRTDMETELRRSRETTATTLASIAEAVVTTDAAGRVTFLNAVAEGLLGWTAETAHGRPLAEVFPGPGQEAGADDVLPAAGETEIVTRAGKRLVVDASIAQIKSSDGDPTAAWGRVVVFRDVTKKRARQAEVESLAYRDALTGLANRASFEDRLGLEIARARRSGEQLALFFLDLDDFKGVNDTLGHAAGDLLLQGVATRLRAALREQDTVARVGGDEFTVLLPGLSGAGDAATVADKILAALSTPHHIHGHEVAARTSLGLALFPADGDDGEALLRCADRAMYVAKADGGGRWIHGEPAAVRAGQAEGLSSRA